MAGGLMQLVAYGAQDIYLTGNPQITFFKVVYRRYTNFSVESIQQTFNGTPDFGNRVSATISRNGDLMHRVYLELTTPEILFQVDGSSNNIQLTVQDNATNPTITDGMLRWVNWLGEFIINWAEVEIGGSRIDRHYGEWLHVWSQLTVNASQQAAYNRMVGQIPALTNNYVYTSRNKIGQNSSIPSVNLKIPLQFWFCRNPGLALPLIALQYHEVKINIEFQELKFLLIAAQPQDPYTNLAYTPVSFNWSNWHISNCSLWVDYVYLDTDERRRFAQLSHEYLIEQLQYPGAENIVSANNKIRLNLNHPVKEIIWVTSKNQDNLALQYWNYTDNYDTSPSFTFNPLGSELMQGITEYLVDSMGGSLAIGPHPDVGSNCTAFAKIQLNGQDRFTERDGDYFNYVQTYDHHTRTPQVGVNVYSFALKPEEHQPSGTCNFSRIDNANLLLQVTTNTLYQGELTFMPEIFTVYENYNSPNAKPSSASVRIFATNYNILRIMSGMGGLAYSN